MATELYLRGARLRSLARQMYSFYSGDGYAASMRRAFSIHGRSDDVTRRKFGDEEDGSLEEREMTPWVRSVARYQKRTRCTIFYNSIAWAKSSFIQ